MGEKLYGDDVVVYRVLEKIELAARRTAEGMKSGPGLYSEGVAFERFAEQLIRLQVDMRK